MSGQVYHLYKTLTEDQQAELNVLTDPCEGIYVTRNEELPLILESTGGSMDNEFSVENTDAWDPKMHDCIIKQCFTVDTEGIRHLFMGGKKIASRDAALGIAALWFIDKSSVSGCEPLGHSITLGNLPNADKITFEFNRTFPAGTLSGSLHVSYILYLKTTSLREEVGIANVVGTRLGQISVPLMVHIDGVASSFPTQVAHGKDRPLWWLSFSEEMEPLVDPFNEEYISLVLNEDHVDYRRLRSKDKYDTPLFFEVLSSAIEEMFRRLYITDFKNDMADIENANEGSIAEAVAYMRSTFNIQIDTVDHLHVSVRKMVSHQLREGGVL